MQNFAYHRPNTLAAAVAALKEDEDAKVLSGGQSLLPVMKLDLAAPTALVSLAEVPELRGIRRDGDRLVIGAAATHAEVESSDVVAKAIPALAQLASHIGDPQVRNRGTLGGSVAHNDPAADYPAALVALDAQVVTDRRTIAAGDFFVGMLETALAPDEIVVEVSFRVPERASYSKFPHPASRFAVVGVMVATWAAEVRVAVVGAKECVYRDSAMEAALAQNFAAEAVAATKVDADALQSDATASAPYRANLVRVMAKRAVEACL